MQTTIEERSRRALLGAGLGALAATVAAALGRPIPARAANGDTVKVGGGHVGTNATSITNVTNGNIVFHAGTLSGIGVLGASDGGIGVRGTSAAPVGGDNAGVIGVATKATNGAVGVIGRSTSGIGVLGQSNAQSAVVGSTQSGVALRGQADNGVGLLGFSQSGYALHADGRVRLDRVAGVAAITAGKTSVVVAPGVDVHRASFVFLTPVVNIGSRAVWYTKDLVANTITIRMSSSRSSITPVSWLLLG